MRLSELAGEGASPDPEIRGLTSDSRAVRDGFLFAALAGEKVDGAKYVPQAEENGAAAILARQGVVSNLPVILDAEPRRRLAKMAAKFYAGRPELIAGVTGTNGKTSTAHFAAALWRLLGEKSGSIGTLGACADGFSEPLGFTTPEPVALHKALSEMTAHGVERLVMEVSSHGLAQYRADGVCFDVAAFTNITQDHLDYHANFEDYVAAKRRLFSELTREGGVAVVNADGAGAEEFIDAARSRGLRLLTTGARGEDVKLTGVTPTPNGLRLNIECEGAAYDLNAPLVGAFQAENAALAAGIVIASGAAADRVLPLLDKLPPVPGRMELAATAGGAAVYVDYAHTPDAVAAALTSLRPHVENRLIAIIGAGGDRDKTKRPLMGRAASTHADEVIVTDDNPRTEDPAEIRRAVLEGVADGIEVGNRAAAIAHGVSMLGAGDVLLIAGKGHETGQIVGDKTIPFSDVEVARTAAAERSKEIGK